MYKYLFMQVCCVTTGYNEHQGSQQPAASSSQLAALAWTKYT